MITQRCTLNFSTNESSFPDDGSLRALPLSHPSAGGELSRAGHLVVAAFLGLVFLLGFQNNFLVLSSQFEDIRTPINFILLNINVSDMLVCTFATPFSFAASLKGRCLIGNTGCRLYGFANSLFDYFQDDLTSAGLQNMTIQSRTTQE